MSAPPPSPDPTLLDARGLALRFAAGAVGLVLGFGLIGALLRDQLGVLAEQWVAATGLGGMFLAVATFDCVPTPIPPDLFTGFALMAEVDFWTIVAVSTAGSITGGSVAWTVGRQFRKAEWFQRRIQTRWASGYALVQRYGTAALVLGALSPLPFSVTCYAAGALHMRYGPFLAVALLRGPRMLLYLALIRLGWVGLG